MNRIFKFSKRVSRKIDKNSISIVIVLGLVSLLLGYTEVTEPFHTLDEGLKEFFKVIGTTSFSGGVFLVIVKSSQFEELFTEAVRHVIYSKEHLDERKDIYNIWVNVSNSLFRHKFPDITSDMFKSLKENYLPVEDEFYFEYLSLDSTYLHTEESNYVKVINTVKAEIVADDPDGIPFEFFWDLKIPIDDNNRTSYCLEEITINNKTISDPMSSEYLVINRLDDRLKVAFKIQLTETGRTTYEIKRRETLVYNIKNDSITGYKAIWIYKKFNVRIEYPEDLDAIWISSGVLKDWNPPRISVENKRIIDTTYDGIIFKNQGFVLIFNNI